MSTYIATYTVTGMTCSHCESAVRAALEPLPGITSVEASAEAGTVVVQSESLISDETIIAAIEEEGYNAVRD